MKKQSQKILKKNTPVSDLPVIKSHCKTCPFKPTKSGWLNVDLANKVIERNLFKSQQICHGTEGENRAANNRCKGYFDYSFEIYKRMGLDPEKNLIK